MSVERTKVRSVRGHNQCADCRVISGLDGSRDIAGLLYFRFVDAAVPFRNLM
jgi:hypothetical protein